MPATPDLLGPRARPLPLARLGGRLDILDDPASPVVTALAGGAAVVIAAGVLALGPGIMAARRRAATVLRSE